MRHRAPVTASRTGDGTGAAWRLVATGAGVGRLPFAPGTAGSLLGAVLCFPLLSLPRPVYLGATVLLAVLAVWVAGRAASEAGEPDPAHVVIDEIVGMWVAAIALSPSLYDVAAVFLLFRLMDVVKPAPIPRLERLPGGLGIVADDVAAGLLARAAWWLLQANFDFL
ncbi:MAG: phosphatidylglycerophosphatase A [candidate division NC10 bacterium]|nr:phosphatidylglycerophosphatase A [candidate division NC10 bacterium]